MKANFLPIAALFLLGVYQAAWAEPDPLNGKRLFEASRCMECHSTDMFTRPEREVSNLAELESQVRTCDTRLSTNWFDDQILDVVAWLNQAYYKFPPVQQQSNSDSSAPSDNNFNLSAERLEFKESQQEQ